MFNETDEIIHLMSGDELNINIIKSIEQAKTIIKDYLGIDIINASSVTSAGINPLNRATIFKFFENHSSRKNKKIFNETWINTIFDIATKKESQDIVWRSILTLEGRENKLTNVFKGSLKKDMHLILHLLWCNKAILLPYPFKLPTGTNPKLKNESRGNNYEYAASSYPELLSIARQPFVKHIDFKLLRIEKIIPETTIQNFGWYFINFIRSSTWWKVNDITNQDIIDIITSPKSKVISYKSQFLSVRSWLSYITELYPEKCKFSLNDTLITSIKNGQSDEYVPHEIRDKIIIWSNYINLWESKLRKKGMASSIKKKNVVMSLITYFKTVIFSENGHKHVPYPKDFSRKYLDGWGNTIGFLDYMESNINKRTFQKYLYDVNDFFIFLETYQSENGFKNIIDMKCDTPHVRRSKGTKKVIFPTEYYPPFVSYLYGLSEWVWFMINQSLEEVGQLYLIHYLRVNHKRYWDTQKTGFVPIFWMKGKAIPIFAIPYGLAPISYRYFKNRDSNRRYKIVDPHYIHLATILYETGIRLKHANWLDARLYDQHIDRKNFNAYSFDVCELYVNTDKAHGPWTCFTSQAVLALLDRQKFYQNIIDKEKFEDLVYYDKNPNTGYEKIQCLFYKGNALNPSRNIDASPVSDSRLNIAFKKILFAFNVILAKETEHEPFINLPRIANRFKDNDRLFFYSVFSKRIQDNLKIDITPHSARSQVVSHYINLLPPSIIRKITGHSSDQLIAYYTQLDRKYLDKIKKGDAKTIFGSLSLLDQHPLSINAEEANSALRIAFEKNRLHAVSDFGATSFTIDKNIVGKDQINNGLKELINARNNHIAFNTTHICPFNNQCPNDIVNDFKVSTNYNKPCGRCYYAVKTVDHLPRILSTIRALTDECVEIESYINTAKKTMHQKKH